MNSAFRIEDASEGSPFGFDTTFLQDNPVEIKAIDRLKKSSKSKRLFESRLLIDPYLLSRQVENGKLSSVVKKLFIEPYTLVFTSEDYESDNDSSDLEKHVPEGNSSRFYDKQELLINKGSSLLVNHLEKTYEPPIKKKKIFNKELSEVMKTDDFSKFSNVESQSHQKPSVKVVLENNMTCVIPTAERIANTVAKDIAERMGRQLAERINHEIQPATQVATMVSAKPHQETKISDTLAAQTGQPVSLGQNNSQKVQVRLSDGRILLMSRELFLKLRESGPANNSAITTVEQKSALVQQQSKPVLPSTVNNTAPTAAPVRPNCVLRLPNSQAVNGTLDNLLTFMRESNLGSGSGQNQSTPGPRFIIQQRSVGSNVKQVLTPVGSNSSSPQIKFVAAQGGNNSRIIVNSGSSLAEQLSKIQQLQTKTSVGGVSPSTSAVQPYRIVTTQRVVPRHAIVVPNSGPNVHQRPTSYILASRIGQGQLRLPFSAQNQPVRLCLMPTVARNLEGSASVTSPTQNLVVMNTPGSIRQVNFNNFVKINAGQSSPNLTASKPPSPNLSHSGNNVTIQRPQNLIILNGQQQLIPKTNPPEITSKTT